MGFLLSLDPEFSDIDKMAFKKNLFYMFCMYYVCVQCLQKPQEGTGSLK